MPTSQVTGKARRSGPVLTFAAAALAGLTTPAHAEFISARDVQRGFTMTRAQCAALDTAVWVTVHGRTFCMRYYLSTVGGEGREPVVFLQGDKPWILNTGTMQWVTPPGDGGTNTENLQKFADSFSQAAKTTAIYLARIGMDGSSGNHNMRQTVLELRVTHAALDAIKRQHGFEGFHLVGQSTGGTLIGGLLSLRTDIGCAVPGAGRLSRGTRRSTRSPSSDPAKQYFNSVEMIPAIVRHSKARILVITDPKDQTVIYESQTPFVKALRKAGGKVEQYFVQALDAKHHGMVAYARPAVAACIRGATETQISAGLAKVMARQLGTKAKKEAEAADNPPGQPEQKRTRPAPKAKLQGT